MVAVVGPSSGGSVLANFSSVCQFLVTEVRRATTSVRPAPSRTPLARFLRRAW